MSESLPAWIPNDDQERLESTGTASVGLAIPEHGQIALLGEIESDPRRKPFEKESNLLWNAGSDVLNIYTAEPALMRRWILHPTFRLQWLEVSRDERGTRHMDSEEFKLLCSDTDSPPEIPSVHAVSGIGHVGLLKASETPRSSGGHSQIVTSAVLENDPRKNGGDSP